MELNYLRQERFGEGRMAMTGNSHKRGDSHERSNSHERGQS